MTDEEKAMLEWWGDEARAMLEDNLAEALEYIGYRVLCESTVALEVPPPSGNVSVTMRNDWDDEPLIVE